MDTFYKTNQALLAALGSVVQLPANLMSLKLSMGVSQAPTLELVHSINVDDRSAPGREPVSRRYTLVEVEP